MLLRGGDDDGLMACFEETAPATFALLCRLTNGDHRRAQDLLSAVYVHAGRDAARLGSLDCDAAWWRTTAIELAGTSDADAADSPAAAAHEVWLDDRMRAEARAAITLGDGAPSHGAPPARTRRRIVVACAAVAVLVSAAVLIARPGDSRSTSNQADAVIRTTSTSASTGTVTTTNPATTTPATVSDPTAPDATDAPATTAAPATQPGYIADPLPAGFVANGAYFSANEDDVSIRPWLSVWAAPGATHTEGRWLAVMTNPYGDFSVDAGGQQLQRIRIRDRVALQQTDPDGIRQLVTTLDDRSTVRIAASGLSDDEIIGVVHASSIAEDGRLVVGPAAADVLDGLDVLSASWVDGGDVESPVVSTERTALYQTPEGTESVTVASGPQAPNDLAITALLTPASADATAEGLAPNRTVTSGGRTMVVGQSGATAGSSPFVMWHDGTDTVVVSGTPDVAELLTIAEATRRATLDEWFTQLRTIIRGTGTHTTEHSVGDSSYATIGMATTTVGDTWTVAFAAGDPPMISIDEQKSPQSTVAGAVPSGFTMFTSAEPALTTYVGLDATVVVYVSDPVPTFPAGASLQITVGDSVPTQVPLSRAKDSTRVGAAYAFSSVARFTAQIVDARGQVLVDLTA
ncbi:MAG: hypothetical protein JWM34_4229 [Ilumatobacteraceae bacterium]|nr:hypothetical protein [Ilumatobacteraceae bacterium]